MLVDIIAGIVLVIVLGLITVSLCRMAGPAENESPPQDQPTAPVIPPPRRPWPKHSGFTSLNRRSRL